ncbi:hypothetical protein CDD81_117 [Ophiocordyceps australis]|uniref:Uncharacterized protein n=1 Tax=Ophiocordyceps australis TaxID=1399860 RepID=A0A2C5YKA0_9HYPO|nr:hypothetical protein CDD81_117 [Ophiocordyceps australis]
MPRVATLSRTATRRDKEHEPGANEGKTSTGNEAEAELQSHLTFNGRQDVHLESSSLGHGNVNSTTVDGRNQETQIQGTTRKKLPNSRQEKKTPGDRASVATPAKRPNLLDDAEPLSAASPTLKTRVNKKRHGAKNRRILQDRLRTSIERLNTCSQQLLALQSTVEALSAQIATLKDNEAELRADLDCLLE